MTTPPVERIRASHIIEQPEVHRWLAEHGVDIADVYDVTVHVGRHYDTGTVTAWLDVDWYTRNDHGVRYLSGNREDAATGHSTIPLTSWPTLTPVD